MYKGLFSTFRQYWSEYGGLWDLIRSPFAHFSFVVTIFYAFGYIDINWRELVKSSLPTILGFSLAAYTITFTLMGSALHRALASTVDKTSGKPLIRIVNSTFFHVIVFQSAALLYAILSHGSLFPEIIDGVVGDVAAAAWLKDQAFSWGDVVGCFLAIYSFFLLLSVGVAMFRLGRITPPSASNDGDGGAPARPAIATTRRFRFIVWLSKQLRLYDRS